MNLFRTHFINGLSTIKVIMIRTFSSATTPKADLALVKNAAKHIVWMDMEMTGLDIDKDHIMEIACLITDAQLNVVATGPNLIIHHPEDVLKGMGDWCIAQHGASGLTESCRKSNVTLRAAENELLDFIKTQVPEKKCPLAGNSVYMDRLFLRKYMPKVDSYLHYRIIDVSTLKELGKRWYQKEFSNMPMKKFNHRAVDDIFESIEEMKYYRQNIFKS